MIQTVPQSEAVRLSGGPLHDTVATVIPGQLGLAVRQPREVNGQTTLGNVPTGTYYPDGSILQGYEIWVWWPLWADAA